MPTKKDYNVLFHLYKKVLRERDEARAELQEYHATYEAYRETIEAQENELDVLRGKVEMVELIFGKGRDDG